MQCFIINRVFLFVNGLCTVVCALTSTNGENKSQKLVGKSNQPLFLLSALKNCSICRLFSMNDGVIELMQYWNCAMFVVCQTELVILSVVRTLIKTFVQTTSITLQTIAFVIGQTHFKNSFTIKINLCYKYWTYPFFHVKLLIDSLFFHLLFRKMAIKIASKCNSF